MAPANKVNEVAPGNSFGSKEAVEYNKINDKIRKLVTVDVEVNDRITRWTYDLFHKGTRYKIRLNSSSPQGKINWIVLIPEQIVSGDSMNINWVDNPNS